MMQSEANKPPQDGNDHDACWSRIGIGGDRSCPRLTQAIHCRNCPVYSAAGERLFNREAPPQYVEEWTQRIAEADTTAAADEFSVLVFRMGDEWLAFDTHDVAEVVEIRPIRRVPNRTNGILLGLVNIRGELQLCVSLRELLGIESNGPHPNPLPKGEGTGLGHLPKREGAFVMDSSSVSSPVVKERLLVVEQNQNRWVFPVDEVEGVHRINAKAAEDVPHTVEKSDRHFSRMIFPHRDRKVGMISRERLFQALEKSIR
jgi:chemotaxis-related protein WspD